MCRHLFSGCTCDVRGSVQNGAAKEKECNTFDGKENKEFYWFVDRR